MSFWDKVKNFAQPYADEDYDEYDDEEMEDYEDEEEVAEEPAPRASRRASAFNTSASTDTASDFGTAPVSNPTPASSASPISGGFSGTVLNMNTGSKQEVVLFHAKTFDDAASAADELRSKRAVILNMEGVDSGLTRRVVDFLTGCVYALEGQVKKVAQATYLFCPHGMEILGDLESIHSDIDSYV